MALIISMPVEERIHLYTGSDGSRFVYKCKTVFRIVAYCMADEQNDLIIIRYGLTVFHIMPSAFTFSQGHNTSLKKIMSPLTLD